MKAWKSGVWSLTGQFFRLVVTMGTLAILGRLLTPAQFGLFGLIMAVQVIILPVLDMGLQPAYIKMTSVDDDASNAFFTVNVIVGGVFSILLILIAPWLASFYNAEALSPLLIGFSIVILFTAASGQPQAVLNRKKEFKKIVLVNSIVVFSGAGLVILLAASGFGVWSLIWRAIFEAVIKFFLLVMISGRRFQLIGIVKIKPYIRDLKFGLEIFSSRIINSWVKGVDKLILGKYILLSDLGGYTRSQQLALMPNGQLQMPISSVAISYFARATEKDKLDKYILLNWVFFLIAGVPCLLIIVYGDYLLPLLLGQQWASVGWLFQWMGMLGLGRVFQDMSTFYHIDRRAIKRTVKYVLGAIPIVLIIPVVLLVVTSSLEKFVILHSCLIFLYWFIVAPHTMVIDNLNSVSKIIRVNIKYLVIIILSITIGFLLKSESEVDFHALILGIGMQYLLTLVLFPIIDIKFYKMLFKKFI